ncbi:hypothetical protein L911_2985 [Vibrio fluvialis I21563]|jgi:hypothetical protein|uniref:YnhF family membrane protein n=2 Tax=Vibrio fluvialis TaxID=676 RepID=A0AAX2LUS0_VIBFL|nr:hypothetical protein L911_2985 [Vibrio fluvialis I21563]EPP24691.1 hypothetical protein L910_2137 [Vibrio fluvialis PG41]SUQ26160.1 Uncharacterised protein [Vibrio fluvialis]SUQ27719.1 Uncharacterised protein [Vibrio fluvialis]SUQ33162.1 Uncharacterised protein [Vibrio furnissii]
MYDKKQSWSINLRELFGMLAMFSATSLVVLMLSLTWVNF